ncbi:MAG TPA: hypothetical protein DDZ80_05675 [Cyanobacteria bacterium UBA8803]|nr:hypothetical protein [Cyanobacteria bacterium UBA9273]HBL58026.1 hypothetical protein [Cyanobacteria bacterium UBA8803]
MNPLDSQKILASEVKSKTKPWTDGLIFVIAMWLLSRLTIFIAMQLVAPLLPLSPAREENALGFTPNFVPQIGWELFSHWDGVWYRQIAISGYDYANTGGYESVAFFPLFPLLTRGVMTLGLPFEVAGTLVNSLAFLGALFLLYRWANKCYGIG